MHLSFKQIKILPKPREATSVATQIEALLERNSETQIIKTQFQELVYFK